ncbi:MAG: hypothetical protein PHV82_11845 [Victivallaceae bacterium]|nr:hypothetical protein [Victivallaceae bacterium]
MQAIREIKTVHSKKLSINIPDFLRDKQVEILIFPFEEENRKQESFDEFVNFVSSNKFHLPAGYKFDRNELHER